MVSCAACTKEIYSEYDGERLEHLEGSSDSSISAIHSDQNSVIVDSGIAFCSDECAPRGLRENPPDKDPLQELIEFFHSCNTDESREYYHNRGWSDETIDELLLGWAPPDESKAYRHMKEKGYSVAEILSTGAFTQREEPPYECVWRGRYVLPYFDENGAVKYAISRSTGTKGGGAAGYDGHPADVMSGKYTKLSKNKAFSIYEEPIYGIHSLAESDEDRVLIAEGIPDAITAIQDDYATLSPVTTQFSHEQYDEVKEIISDEEFSTVYIVPDNEEVQESQEDQDLDISVGLQGGLKTAAHLKERDLDADIRIVEIPRPDGETKVDLDDYLNENDRSEFEALLETADEPEDHEEAFEDIRKTVEEQIEYREQQRDHDGPSGGSGDYSAIYDLSILDVLPSDFSRKGDRGSNPIQHIGDSRNYFSVTEYKGSLIAHDFKRNVTYTPLTYVLCELGERDVDDPNGSMSNREIWLVWKWCKENGIIPEDDPLPSAAITHLAESESDIGYTFSSQEEKEEGFVPYDVYVNVLKTVENKYGLDSGRDS